MSSATVLYVNISGVSSEILKNLVLAGIRGAIADGRPYPQALAETPTSFLPPSDRCLDTNDEKKEGSEQAESDAKRVKRMSVAKAMQPHVYELNPLLEECAINEDDLEDIPSDYFSKYDIVVASNIGMSDAIRISNAVTGKGGKFFLVHSFGLYACAMIDLGKDHPYREEMGKDKLSDVKKVKPYKTLEEMFQVKLADAKDRWHKNGAPLVYAQYRTILHYYSQKKEWPSAEKLDEFVTISKNFLKDQGMDENVFGEDEEGLKSLALTATAEVSPVCAVMGGVLGNEVIKAISGKGAPANNTLLFDGTDGGCKSFVLV